MPLNSSSHFHVVSVFGDDASSLNFDRDPFITGQMLSFNANYNEIHASSQMGNNDSPPRRCPGEKESRGEVYFSMWGRPLTNMNLFSACSGYSIALDIIEFLVNRYFPVNVELPPTVSDKRLQEISKKESRFTQFVLHMGRKVYTENNQYFPHASEVKHPLDTAGCNLGSIKISAAGYRTIPAYGRFVTVLHCVGLA